jgi:hypothetical protein
MASRFRWIIVVLGIAFLLFCIAASQHLTSAAAQDSKPSAPIAGKYLGPGSCSAVACHGGIQPIATSRILQNEYSTWIVQDKHAKAYSVLQSPISQRMAHTLGLGKPDTAPKCLACHALSVSAAQKGRELDLTEGVSCESCHGPSSAWLGPHNLKGWTTKQSIAMGMFDTKNLIHRAEVCLSCHLGTAEKSVDHEMIAAGHPDLIFELDAYSAVEPAHWKPSADPYAGVRSWSVGQAVQLRERLKRLSRRVQGPVWPEYSEMDCFSCHHSLVRAEDSWRQNLGYRNRRPGNAPWNDAHYSVFRTLVKDIDPELSKELEGDLSSVYAQASRFNSDRKVLTDAADHGADIASRLAVRLDAMNFDKASTARLLRAICADADHIASQGPRSAEQATMALDSAFIAYSKDGGSQPEVRAGINALFQQLDNPSAYSAPRFAAGMKKVGASLK